LFRVFRMLIVAAIAIRTERLPPMPRTFITDWKRVATSGKTIDGRTIEAQDLRDMAATYDPAVYTAVIWFEHIRYMGNFGTVAEVKTEDVAEGKVGLFAKLQPNEYLLAMNKDGQKIFSSVEIQPNFADTGKAYLCGMAVTDEPASLGTEPLHFSRRAGTGNHFANVEQLDDLTPANADEETVLSFFARLFKTVAPPAPITPLEETPMDAKTALAFATAVDKLGTVATSLETSAATFAKQAPVTTTEPEKVDVVVTDPVTATGITAAQYNELKGSVDKLAETFNTALNQTKGKTVPVVTGAADDKPEAVY
jgi:hypothetical protein